MITPPKVDVKAWVPSILAAFHRIGSEKIAGLGLTSLTQLSTPGDGRRREITSNPEIFRLLTVELAGESMTPEDLARLGANDAASALFQAAYNAERAAARRANAALAAFGRGLDDQNVGPISAELDAARLNVLYLEPGQLRRLAAASASAAHYSERKIATLRDYRAALPGRIASGNFDSSLIYILPTRHGWVFQDEGLEPRSGELYNLLSARIGTLRLSPREPWAAAKASRLLDATRLPHVIDAIPFIDKIPFLQLELNKIVIEVALAAAEDNPLNRARAAFRRGPSVLRPIAPRHLRAVVTAYVKFHNVDPILLPSRDAWIIAGEKDGLPSWNRLLELRDITFRRLTGEKRLATHATLVGSIASLFFGFPMALLLIGFPFALLVWSSQRLEAYASFVRICGALSARLRAALDAWPVSDQNR